MRTLVTGITGFAGGHLAEALLAAGEGEVAGLARHARWPAAWGHLSGRVALYACDLADPAAVEAVLRAARPERVYHLAGYASVGRSFREPEAAWAGNLGATRCLYEAVLRWGGRPRILFVGSGLVYGAGEPPGQPQDEGCLLRPDSPYAASKAAADLASYQYTCSPGLDVVRARPFNHIGPAQSPDFAIASFARQLVEIERGLRPPVLETGNLSPERDLTDVRDTVAAYRLLMERGRTGEAYNVARGTSLSVGAVLRRLIELAGLSVELRQRAELVRAADTAVVRADASRLRRETGWAPRYALDSTLADTLAYWRGHLDQAPAGGRTS
jgi:GDP-4-dehydro-6-deoxy-D-mannose reductase